MRNKHLIGAASLVGLAALLWGLLVACQPAERRADRGALPDSLAAWQRRTPEGPWHQGVGYSLFVRSFADTDGDGKGDLRGTTARLDYLAGLGVRNLWLLPVQPSPTYHKYDVTDYQGIDTTYGTLADFDRLLAEAHRRGIRVTLDLVLNHCSREHPWFQAALKGPSSPYYDWFVWQQAGDTTRQNWHRVRGRNDLPRYYGFFWGGMPDLNLDNPAVRAECIRIARYWLDRGVDGFRLDAAQHIYEHRTAEGRAKSVAWWRTFRDSLRATHPQVYLIGEVWSGPQVVREFYQGLDGCFNFGLAEQLTRAVQRDNADSLARALSELKRYQASLPPGAVDCTFLSNHDQPRIASRLGRDPVKLKRAASLLMSLPGMPWLYYGEELGVPGRKPDPRLREPYPWGGDDALQTRWMRPRYTVADSVRSLAEQQTDTASVYAHYRRLIAERARR